MRLVLVAGLAIVATIARVAPVAKRGPWRRRKHRYVRGTMDGLVYMDAVITPNRSLSQRGFIVLICIVTFFNCAAAAVFLAMGATLVPFFLGLDVLAIIAAFLASYASAKRVERVQVTDAGRALLHSDQFALHPELLQAEIARIEAERAAS